MQLTQNKRRESFLIEFFCRFFALTCDFGHRLGTGNFRFLAASMLLSSLCGAPALYAQQQSGPPAAQSAISTDRPSITDSSMVVPLGDLLFENGFDETASQGERSFDFTETLIRYGLTSKTELRITPPDYFENYNSTGRFGSGFGDFSLGAKQQLRVTTEGFNVALILSLSFPTGAKALSSDGYDPEILLPWSHPISRKWMAAGMFGLLFPTQSGSHNMTGQASFLIDRQLTRKWDAFIEYGGEFPSLGTPQHIFDTGTTYKIRANQQLDVHFGEGFSGATPDHFVGFGYSFQLPSLIRRAARPAS